MWQGRSSCQAVLLAILAAGCVALKSDYCPALRDETILESDAQVTLGAIVQVHDPGEAGMFGCGKPLRQGIEVFEALKWSLGVINSKSDEIVPGVKFGLKVLDNCGHSESALRHLTSQFPVMTSGPEECASHSDNSSFLLGLMDTTGLTNDPRVAEMVQRYSVPLIPLKLSTSVPAEYLAKIILEVTHDFEWERVAILHVDDEYSIQAIKTLGQIALPKKLCIQAIEALPSPDSDISSFKKVVGTLTSKLLNKTSIVVIGEGMAIDKVLQVLSAEPEILTRLQWLFSWIPSPDKLTMFANHLNHRTVFSLAPLPSKIDDFEKYWSRLIRLENVNYNEDRWFLNYISMVHKCSFRFTPQFSQRNKLPPCENVFYKESAADVLQRTSRAIPAFHAIATIAHAFRRVWQDKCKNQPGVCPQLREMARSDFVKNYLDPLEFQHEPKTSPVELSGKKSRNTGPGEIEEMKLSVASYSYTQEEGVNFKQIISYDSHKAEVIDTNFEYVTALCVPESICSSCAKIRQSRTDDKNMVNKDDSTVFVDSQDGLVIPLVVPLHNSWGNTVQCDTAINPNAMQNLEAALWAIDQVNADPNLLPGVHLKAAIVDSCGSPIKATQHISKLLFSSDHSNFDTESTLASISLASKRETKASQALFQTLNITTLSIEDMDFDLSRGDSENFILQIPTHKSKLAQSIIEILKYAGWKHVSIVYSDDEENVNGFTEFSQIAKSEGICLATSYKISNTRNNANGAILELIKAQQTGSNVVIVWCNEKDTSNFFDAVRNAIISRRFNRGDFVWLGSGEWSRKLEVVRGLEEDAAGAIVFRPKFGEIPEFSAYYKRLNPQTNIRNPWFQDFWQQTMQCKGANCNSANGLPYSPNVDTIKAIQAVVALAFGVDHLRGEMCPHESGLCLRFLQQPQLRQLLAASIRHAISERPDIKGEGFNFTPHGYGNIPIEIFNLQRVPGNGFAYQKVGTYFKTLTQLVNLASYNQFGEKIALESKTSECTSNCEHCPQIRSDFLLLPSPSSIYLAAVFAVHHSSSQPFGCGHLKNIENLEAFLWAIDRVDEDPNILPNVHLGAFIIDSCSNKDKTFRDMSNLLSGTLGSLTKDRVIPDINSVAGLILNEGTSDHKAIVDIASSSGITTILPLPSSGEISDTNQRPFTVPISPSNPTIAKALLEILKQFQWNHFSVVYSGDNWMMEEIARHIKSQTQTTTFKTHLIEKIPTSANYNMVALINRLIANSEQNSRIVLVLLDTPLLYQFLNSLEKVSLSDNLVNIYFAEDIKIFQRHARASLGSLVIHQPISDISPFASYFSSLDIRNNSRNPWFREYWENRYSCHGAECFNTAKLKNLNKAEVTDPTVWLTIQSVYTFTKSLDALVRQACQNNMPCHDVMNLPSFKRDLNELTKRVTAPSRNLILSNYVRAGTSTSSFVKIGSYNKDVGLLLNNTKIRGYDASGREFSLNEFHSRCDDCAAEESQHVTSIMQIGSNQEFAVSALLPIHMASEKDFFSCGNFSDPGMFQNLVAFLYALDKINNNKTLLPEIKLGALVIDYCGRKQKALEQTYTYFSNDDNSMTSQTSIKPSSIISTLTFSEDIAEDLSPILQAVKITQITNPIATKVPETSDSGTIYATATALNQLDAVVKFVRQYKWNYVYVLHSNDEYGYKTTKEFVNISNKNGICVADQITIPDGDNLNELVNTLIDKLNDDQVRVIVLITDDNVKARRLIQTAKIANVLRNYVWIINEVWDNSNIIANLVKDVPVDIFTVKTRGLEIADFKDYLSKFTLGHHDPIPDEWFQEFWQHHFKCQLPRSQIPQKQYSDICSGTEKIDGDQLIQNRFVYQTIKAVDAIGEGLSIYLNEKCSYGARNIDECGENARTELSEEIKRILICEDCGNLINPPSGHQVFQWEFSREGTYYPNKIGWWQKDKWVQIKNSSELQFLLGKSPLSTCINDCNKCISVVDREEAFLYSKEPLLAHFKTIWGITATALSILGIILVMICTLYFLMAFPLSVGTTILGYMILFGLMVLYAVNFAFIVAPTETTCGIRRFVLGLAYSIIFAGMLVKVLNTWRLMGYNGNRMFNDGTRLSSPTGLLIIAIGLVVIQVVLTAAWLVLMPPKIGAYNGLWRCEPPGSFEDELVLSLVYVMLLLAVTILFALLTWKCQDNNRESRWILMCCLLVGVVWIGWTTASTQLPITHHRDATIVCANLLCASLVMVCLYVRKVYLFTKLTRMARDREMKMRLQPSPNPNSLYGALQDNLSPVLFGSQATLNNKKIFGSRSKIRDFDDARSDSSGSVQVQATDLYPLDMYDGGSQFQPISSVYGSRQRVNEDNLPFPRY